HRSKDDKDTVFHPVTKDGPCKLDAVRAEEAMLKEAGGSMARFLEGIREPLNTAQCTLQCCLKSNCDNFDWRSACGFDKEPPACAPVRPKAHNCRACFVPLPHDDAPTRLELGGSARIASTFAELLLLEYANRFPDREVGFGRAGSPHIVPKMYEMFRLHTEAFRIEQRTPYIAKLQGSRLITKILLALQGKDDGKAGTAPAKARFVAYVGHDTSIANLASILEQHWEQPHYQPDQTPPAGALIFELRKAGDGNGAVSAYYAAQSPEAMRKLEGTRPHRSTLFEKLPLDDFARLVGDRREPNPGCWD